MVSGEPQAFSDLLDGCSLDAADRSPERSRIRLDGFGENLGTYPQGGNLLGCPGVDELAARWRWAQFLGKLGVYDARDHGDDIGSIWWEIKSCLSAHPFCQSF